MSLAVFGVISGGCKNDSTSEFAKELHSQENAIAVLTQLGGKVVMRDFGFVKDSEGHDIKDVGSIGAWAVDLSQVRITNEVLEQLALVRPIGSLNLSKSTITDDQVSTLMNYKSIFTVFELDLSDTVVTDQALKQLAGLTSLRDLNLVGSKVTEAGVKRFQELRNGNPSISKSFRETRVHY